ncbi:Uncharacterised protein [Klebsiella pneumoniae]|nr:hypothetical protein L396_05963 [Klebsiella pneumoniae BWH 15]CAB5660442.1 Uncharacterised protein [Klebsiella variicola]SSJ78411.1 Uncharacterised protein [Klebsiella pneumoniae]SSK89331.1 Uncharacterised protein [Klebsiella pneumoniae]SXG90731.1 Uncharacterised protein [Klebsiella pneumoniae]
MSPYLKEKIVIGFIGISIACISAIAFAITLKFIDVFIF